jgi:hypothetical protein
MCGAIIVARETTKKLIVEKMPDSKEKKAHFEAKASPGNKSLAFLFNEINPLNM